MPFASPLLCLAYTSRSRLQSSLLEQPTPSYSFVRLEMTGEQLQPRICPKLELISRALLADYAEERRSELEVLESIFPDELTSECSSCTAGESASCVARWLSRQQTGADPSPSAVISDDKLSVRVEPEVQSPSDPCSSSPSLSLFC